MGNFFRFGAYATIFEKRLHNKGDWFMKLNGTEDLRVQKTIEAIRNAFANMISEMDYEKITVTELCARAKINKKTFYRYYPTLDDLLGELQDEMSQEYAERVADFKLPEELDKVNREFFLYSVEKGDFYDKITCSGNYSYIRQKMIDNVMESTWGKSPFIQQLDCYKRNILYTFIQTSSVEMYKRWVMDGKKVPIEEIIEMTNRLLCQGVYGLIGHHAP